MGLAATAAATSAPASRPFVACKVAKSRRVSLTHNMTLVHEAALNLRVVAQVGLFWSITFITLSVKSDSWWLMTPNRHCSSYICWNTHQLFIAIALCLLTNQP